MFRLWLLERKLKLFDIFVAKNDAKKHDVFKLRFKIYIKMLHKSIGATVDHVRKELFDQEDYLPNCKIYYAHNQNKMIGTIRSVLWQKNDLPANIIDSYQLAELLPNTNSIIKLNYLITDSSDKIEGLSLALLIRAIDDIPESFFDQSLIISACDPGLVKHYQKMGFICYQSHAVYLEDGLRIPIMMQPFNLAHLKKIRSPLYFTAKRKYAKQFSKNFNDHLIYTPIIDCKNVMLNKIYQQTPLVGIFSLLTQSELSEVTGDLVISVVEDKCIVKKNVYDKEIYIILEGEFELIFENKAATQLSKGDIFGEIAFFSATGLRTMDVYSKTSGKLLIIHRNITKQFQKPVIKLLEAINYMLARKLLMLAKG